MGDGKLQQECLLERAGKCENEAGAPPGDTFEMKKWSVNASQKHFRHEKSRNASQKHIGDVEMQRERLPEMPRQ